MSLQELLNSGQSINVTIGLSDLKEFTNDLIQKTKTELEAEIIASQAEELKTRDEACDILKIDQSSLWRWAKRGYLIPVEVGGRRMYKLSDLKRILKGGS
jgi:transcriptional regulator with PAS, ATPase and Fis domain